MKKIEELTYEDFKNISNRVPKKFTLKQAQEIADVIAKQWDLPILDATGSFFIAFTITRDDPISTYEATKARRVKEVIVKRVARFKNVYCSSCGEAFGPGDNGFSHCESHAGIKPVREPHLWEGVPV